jgi:hypothetical protein
VRQWRNILPTESLTLLAMDPNEFDAPEEELLKWGDE